MKKKRRNVLSEVIRWILTILILCCLIFVLTRFVGQSMVVHDESMYPVLSSGDRIIVDKISYRFTNPGRYDLVVFPFEYEEETDYIKRVIGLPGETVQIYNGEILINGTKLDDPYGSELIQNAGLAFERITLKEDEYFVLSDNRSFGADSREPSLGNIKKDQLIGRVLLRVWPFDKIGILI